MRRVEVNKPAHRSDLSLCNAKISLSILLSNSPEATMTFTMQIKDGSRAHALAGLVQDKRRHLSLTIAC